MAKLLSTTAYNVGVYAVDLQRWADKGAPLGKRPGEVSAAGLSVGGRSAGSSSDSPEQLGHRRSGADLGSTWGPFGAYLVSIWGDCGVDMGSVLCRSGVDLGSIWASLWPVCMGPVWC